LISHIFTADPNAVVYDDRVYVYVSHDVDGQTGFDMVDYRGFTSDDMVNWQDLGVLIHVDSLPWATNLYAPGACSKDGKYYLYMPNSGSAIGVAVSDSPAGPFVDPIGGALVSKSFPNANVPWLFDPACFVDDDGQAYLYFGGGDDGGQNARGVRLGDDMISLKDSEATTIETTAFFEASFVHKHEGTYFFSYSSDFSTEHGAALEYLTSDSPLTGFEYQGKFLPNSSINRGNNNHGSIIDYQGKTYVFYHSRKLEQALGVDKVNNRSVAVQEISYGTGGTLNSVPMSSEDFTITQLKCLDGFNEVQGETLAAESGIEVEGKAGETVRVTEIGAGDWVGYSQVDFRDGATRLVLRVAAAQSGGSIDVSLDGCLTGESGTTIGTCQVVGTGALETFAELVCTIDAPGGPHDLCLSFGGTAGFELDSWHLE
jgi:arabinoxylan arabinofuranohydrolase